MHIPSECPAVGLMDCVELAPYASARRMLQLGLGFEPLRKTYGMGYQHMVLMRYSLLEWMELGFDFMLHAGEINDMHFIQIFQCNKIVAYSEYCRLRQTHAAPGN